jgi:hypothetical protein
MRSSGSKFWKFYPIALGVILIFLVVVVALFTMPTPREPTTTPIPVTPSHTPTSTIPPPTSTIVISPTPLVLSGCAGKFSVRVRNIPSTNTEILGGILPGKCVSVMGRTGDSKWVWIKYGGLTGWVAVEYLSIDGEVEQLPIVPDNGQGN